MGDYRDADTLDMEDVFPFGSRSTIEGLGDTSTGLNVANVVAQAISGALGAATNAYNAVTNAGQVGAQGPCAPGYIYQNGQCMPGSGMQSAPGQIAPGVCAPGYKANALGQCMPASWWDDYGSYAIIFGGILALGMGVYFVRRSRPGMADLGDMGRMRHRRRRLSGRYTR